jgi:hypothetical protein
VIWQRPAEQPAVAISFDDGPHPDFTHTDLFRVSIDSRSAIG